MKIFMCTLIPHPGVNLTGYAKILIRLKDGSHFNRHHLGKFSLALILVSSMLVRSSGIPLVVAYTLAIISYSIFILYVFKLGSVKISTTKKSVIAIISIYLVIVANVLITPVRAQYTFSPLIRGVLIISFTSLNLYFIPQQLSSREFSVFYPKSARSLSY